MLDVIRKSRYSRDNIRRSARSVTVWQRLTGSFSDCSAAGLFQDLIIGDQTPALR